MKPLNLDNSPCSPISSNCVVWQGPDISCLNLCTGDTISDVVAAMATELCTILDTLKGFILSIIYNIQIFIKILHVLIYRHVDQKTFKL